MSVPTRLDFDDSGAERFTELHFGDNRVYSTAFLHRNDDSAPPVMAQHGASVVYEPDQNPSFRALMQDPTILDKPRADPVVFPLDAVVQPPSQRLSFHFLLPNIVKDLGEGRNVTVVAFGSRSSGRWALGDAVQSSTPRSERHRTPSLALSTITALLDVVKNSDDEVSVFAASYEIRDNGIFDMLTGKRLANSKNERQKTFGSLPKLTLMEVTSIEDYDDFCTAIGDTALFKEENNTKSHLFVRIALVSQKDVTVMEDAPAALLRLPNRRAPAPVDDINGDDDLPIDYTVKKKDRMYSEGTRGRGKRDLREWTKYIYSASRQTHTVQRPPPTTPSMVKKQRSATKAAEQLASRPHRFIKWGSDSQPYSMAVLEIAALAAFDGSRLGKSLQKNENWSLVNLSVLIDTMQTGQKLDHWRNFPITRQLCDAIFDRHTRLLPVVTCATNDESYIPATVIALSLATVMRQSAIHQHKNNSVEHGKLSERRLWADATSRLERSDRLRRVLRKAQYLSYFDFLKPGISSGHIEEAVPVASDIASVQEQNDHSLNRSELDADDYGPLEETGVSFIYDDEPTPEKPQRKPTAVRISSDVDTVFVPAKHFEAFCDSLADALDDNARNIPSRVAGLAHALQIDATSRVLAFAEYGWLDDEVRLGKQFDLDNLERRSAVMRSLVGILRDRNVRKVNPADVKYLKEWADRLDLPGIHDYGLLFQDEETSASSTVRLLQEENEALRHIVQEAKHERRQPGSALDVDSMLREFSSAIDEQLDEIFRLGDADDEDRDSLNKSYASNDPLRVAIP